MSLDTTEGNLCSALSKEVQELIAKEREACAKVAEGCLQFEDTVLFEGE